MHEMRRGASVYCLLLTVVVGVWICLRWNSLVDADIIGKLPTLSLLVFLYLLSHVLRMFRLALLSLNEREKIFPLIFAHALTAFPSSFLPYKLGEMLRLAAFFRVFGSQRKAGVVWVVERFSDVAVIVLLILVMYVLRLEVPSAMRSIFLLFLVLTVLAVSALFAVAKVFIYLNRHLVLVSRSQHGLYLLRISHAMRVLERDLYRCVEGRATGIALLSVLIWSAEILALSLYIAGFKVGEPQLASLFTLGLFASVAGSSAVGAAGFGLYQSLALISMTVLFGVAALLSLVKRRWS